MGKCGKSDSLQQKRNEAEEQTSVSKTFPAGQMERGFLFVFNVLNMGDMSSCQPF